MEYQYAPSTMPAQPQVVYDQSGAAPVMLAQPEIVYEQSGAAPVMYVQPDQDGAAPVMYAQPDQYGAAPLMYVQPDQYGAAPVMYIQPDQYSAAPVMYDPYGAAPMYTEYMPAVTPNVDHSQGKWFAPGEELPANWVVTSHPSGALQPAKEHGMTDKARESFVITSGTEATGTPTTTTAKESKKQSKKKKKSGACC